MEKSPDGRRLLFLGDSQRHQLRLRKVELRMLGNAAPESTHRDAGASMLHIALICPLGLRRWACGCSGSGQAYSDGADRGRVVKHGTTLSFQYDNGKVWNADYEMDGAGGLKLNGSYYLRQ
ncbi:MAG: hypothetical protein HY675_06190 [Chloroflexi bacterium]|nr:hypothetical protein [Chloroflexota bacterium]